MKKYQRLAGVLVVVLVASSLTACGAKQASQSSGSSSAPTSQKMANGIVGSFQNAGKGSAINLYADGTGRYVYADPVNSDTDDQLTWHKTGDHEYTLKFADSDVTSPITAHLNGNQLTLTGDSNWSTDTMTRANSNLNLSKYLTDHHDGGNNSGQNSSVDPKRVGAMAFQATYDGMPGRETFSFSSNGDTYSFGEGPAADGAIKYKIKGNNVTYWKASDPSNKTTTTVSDLEGQVDADQINDIVSHTN